MAVRGGRLLVVLFPLVCEEGDTVKQNQNKTKQNPQK
jgi:hypothetical protein